MEMTDEMEKFFEEMDANTSNRVAVMPMSKIGGTMLRIKDVVETDRRPSIIVTLSPVPKRRKLIIYRWEYPDHEKYVRQAIQTALDLNIPFEYAP